MRKFLLLLFLLLSKLLVYGQSDFDDSEPFEYSDTFKKFSHFKFSNLDIGMTISALILTYVIFRYDKNPSLTSTLSIICFICYIPLVLFIYTMILQIFKFLIPLLVIGILVIVGIIFYTKKNR